MASSTNRTKSRYVLGGTIDAYPTRLGWWERNILSQQPDDIIVTIDTRYARRGDLIASDIYGDIEYEWIVYQYNTIIDINTELVEGAVIRLPAPNRIL